MIILTEKPSVAASFAAALGVPKKAGFYENGNYCIVYALGHLLENYMPEDYDKNLVKWKCSDLPIIPDKILFKIIDKTKEQLDVVKKCFASHKNDELLLATDAEREGELIGAEILDQVGFSAYGSAHRFWVSEALTKDVILTGMKNAKPLADYADYKNQGYARQTADWLVGINITRFITLSCNKLFTVGRVQTAILHALYEREKAITGFIKEKYFEVSALLSAKQDFSVKLVNRDNKNYLFRFPQNDPRIKEAQEKIIIPATGRIISLKKEKKTTPPPQLFNITGLQKEANKIFSYTPEQTLNIAQSLYEKYKCLSYPRSPSRVMGDENVDLVKGIFEELATAYPDKIIDSDVRLISRENKRLFNSADLQDHHALIPLTPVPQDAGIEEKNVYNLVLERFLTMLKPDHIYFSIKIGVDIAGFTFAGSGIEVLQQGWKKGKLDDEKNEDYSGILENQCYPVKSITVNEKLTEPKKRYTYETILQLLENPRNDEGKHLVGLGTPATRGNILQKLFERKYTVLQGKSIMITDYGKFLIDVILKNDTLAKFISIPETTRWEEELHNNSESFLSGIKDFVRAAVKTTISDRFEQAVPAVIGKCPMCGKDIREGQKNYYCTAYKDQPKCDFVIWKEIAGAKLSAADMRLLLDGRKTPVKKCRSKNGKEFSANFRLDNSKIIFEFGNRKK
ncbi:MAG: topoisomerase C-terminal repeat-containing protein [Spirochaetaceae bacterium]|jgi:DNA topoisomerase-3|nr:topoisomerase C-terminal repeat-containing protein [Spirochaetaceae bacterium]